MSKPKVEVIDTEETEPLQSPKGKEEEEADEEFEIEEKSFLERVSELISCLKKIDGYSDHQGLINFDRVVETTDKRTGIQRENLEEGLKTAFSKFYNTNRDDLISDKFAFLQKDGCVISVGSSGKANIPLSEIYQGAHESNPELITSIEASIYFVAYHVCPVDDFEKISSICDEFQPEEDGEPVNFMGFIGDIIGRVSEKVGGSNMQNLEAEDGSINQAAVGNIVQELIGDGNIGKSIQNMMASVDGKDMDIEKTLSSLLGGQKRK